MIFSVRKINNLNLLALILLALYSCNQKKGYTARTSLNKVKYANCLSIFEHEKFVEVTVRSSENKEQIYVLYKGKRPVNINADAYIKVPIKSIICTSTSHLPALDMLGEAAKLTGFPGTKWIYNASMRNRVALGKIDDVGMKQELDVEKVMSLKPDVLMTYNSPNGMHKLKLIEQAGSVVILNNDYLETTPLGRAEWLKLTGYLTGKVKEADSIFKQITTTYDSLTAKASSAGNRPAVLTGIMYGDVWYLPGGNSYAAKFFEDAGAKYPWQENEVTGSISLGFENVFSKAQKADFWIGTGSFNTYEALADADEKYTYFEAFKNKNIFSYTKKVNELGSNDYLESGYARPDLILADYIQMLQSTGKAGINYHDLHYFEPLK